MHLWAANITSAFLPVQTPGFSSSSLTSSSSPSYSYSSASSDGALPTTKVWAAKAINPSMWIPRSLKLVNIFVEIKYTV